MKCSSWKESERKERREGGKEREEGGAGRKKKEIYTSILSVWVWCCTSVTIAHSRLRQEDYCGFQDILSYRVQL